MRRRRTERLMPLTDTKGRDARPGQLLSKLSDVGGLPLWIQPTGSRHWRLVYRFGGKQRLLALGPYPALSLADARERRDEAKKLFAKDVDPSEAKKQAKRVQAQSGATFRAVAEEYVSKLTQEGRAEATLPERKRVMEGKSGSVRLALGESGGH